MMIGNILGSEVFLVTAMLGVILCNLVIIFLLWRYLRLARRELRQVTAKAQRLEIDMGKQRQVIARMLQLYNESPSMPTGRMDDVLIEMLQQAEESVKDPKPLSDPKEKPALSVSMTGLKDAEILELVKRALANNEIAVYSQPVVTLPARKVLYHEVFSRILFGSEGYIPASKFIAIATDHNLVAAIDKVFLLRCLHLLKASSKAETSTEFFINISAATLGSKDYINHLLDFLTAHPKLSSRMIFEMTQSDSMTLTATAKNVMERLALLGCRFSMDQVKILGVDINRLLELNISFVKLDASFLQKELGEISARKRIRRIKQSMDAHGIHVIIEKVENERQLFNVLDMQFDYGQGYLFGPPEALG